MDNCIQSRLSALTIEWTPPLQCSYWITCPGRDCDGNPQGLSGTRHKEHLWDRYRLQDALAADAAPKIAVYFRHPWSERYYRQGWAIGAAHSTTCLWDCNQRWGLWRCLPALHSMINSTFYEGRTKPPPGWTSWFSSREGERAEFFHASDGWSLSYHSLNQSWTTDIVSTFTTNFAQFTYIQCNTMMLHLGTK